MSKETILKERTESDASRRERLEVTPQARPFIVLIIVGALLLFISEFIVAHTAPLNNLLLSTKWSVIGEIHGISAVVILISIAVALYQSSRLLIGEDYAYRDLRFASAVTALMAFITIAFGNWIYMGYRAPGSVQEFFLQNAPELHGVFFEFKAGIALFTFPLAVAATFILYRYGPQIRENYWLRTVVFMLLAFAFIFFLIAFGLGAAVTKIKPV